MLVDEGFNTSNQQHTLSNQELRRVTYTASREKSLFEEAQQNQQVLNQEVGHQILKVYEEVNYVNKPPRRKSSFNSLSFVWLFGDIARATKSLASLVENHWDTLELQYREALKDLVYTFILGESFDSGNVVTKKTNAFTEFLSTIQMYLILFLVIVKYGSEPISQFFDSTKRLKYFVLNAVEEESVDYQKDLNEVLRDNMTESENKTRMTQEEFRDWLNTIWD
jgi:hypothetical protein